jgi:hypothetical protein
MRIVPAATADQNRGFVVLSGEEACDIWERNRIVAAAGAVGGVGVEVEISAPEGVPSAGSCGSRFLVTTASSAPGF